MAALLALWDRLPEEGRKLLRQTAETLFDLTTAVSALPSLSGGLDCERPTAKGTDGAEKNLGPSLGPRTANSREFGGRQETEPGRGSD
jgi:hypothetical protein